MRDGRDVAVAALELRIVGKDSGQASTAMTGLNISAKHSPIQPYPSRYDPPPSPADTPLPQHP
jgi:hypothetical protein